VSRLAPEIASWRCIASARSAPPSGHGRSGEDPGGRSPFDLDADLRDSALFGSPDTVIRRLREIHELGVDRVMLFLHLGGLPHEKIISSLDLLAREVLPVVKAW
jgi:alkanesulfonate monooxygenase SsuD/methylene tetrahydromethanopterin reductase-like flavin-dependent oxidoreductase (luciferase family)